MWFFSFLSLGYIFSNTVPPDSPHQRIFCKLWSSVIRGGPLMCPWAFSTQSESHRRAHTDNRAARHGFWKVTPRIAFNTLKKSTHSNVHASKWTCIITWAEAQTNTHRYVPVAEAHSWKATKPLHILFKPPQDSLLSKSEAGKQERQKTAYIPFVFVRKSYLLS